MAKGQSRRSAPVDRAAEAVGHALGSVAGTIESLQAQHPHPVEEAREALAAGQETLAAVASKARGMGRRDDQEGEGRGAPDEEGGDAGPPEEHAGDGPCDAHGTESGEAREESRQARPEDRETARGAPDALTRFHLPSPRSDVVRALVGVYGVVPRELCEPSRERSAGGGGLSMTITRLILLVMAAAKPPKRLTASHRWASFTRTHCRYATGEAFD